MAEIVLGIILIVAGLGCGLVAAVVLMANSIGGATAPDKVRMTPFFVFAILAVLGFAGGFVLLI